MSVQTSYPQNAPVAFPGMKADSGFDRVVSRLAEEDIPFGYGLVGGTDKENQVRMPVLNQSILSIDADLISSNSTVATVNGNSTTATVFATDHETTMAAIATKIAALAGVDTATYAGTGRDIVIVGDEGVAISASAVTTGGASQGTWTQAQSSIEKFVGLAVHIHKEPSGVGLNDAEYKDEESVSVMRQGVLWALVETSNQGTLKAEDDVYINVAIGGAEKGKVTSVSTGNVSTGGTVLTYDSSTKLAKVEINLP